MHKAPISKLIIIILKGHAIVLDIIIYRLLANIYNHFAIDHD